MKISTWLIIILAAVLVVYVVVSIAVYVGYDAQIVKLRTEANQIGQSYKTLQDEMTEKIKIESTQNLLLDKVSKSFTLRDYIAVWREVNEWKKTKEAK